MPDQSPPPTLARLREQTIDVLCKHFAEDRLTMGELERRLDRAAAARTRAELATLLTDLSATAGVPAPSTEEQGATRRASDVRAGDVVQGRGEDEQTSGARPARRRRAPITDRDREAAADSVVVAILGGSRKVGRWRPPPHMHAVAFWGGVVLDLRDAILPDGRFEVSAFAVMGGVDIIVPPGLPVEVNGVALLGGFDQAAETAYGDDDEDGPRLVVSGFALMGGVSVKLRAPHDAPHRHGGRHLSREERRLALEERRLERHARRLDRQAERLENRRRRLDGE
jgi:hypothetical protein